MAGRLTLWGAGELLRTYISKTATPPPQFYLALIKDTAPSAYVGGDELDEPTDVAYVRAMIENDALSWTSDSAQLHIISNTVDISFITAGEDWGRIGFWALCNAETSGYVFAVGEMELQEIVNTGDQVVVGANELVIELGPFFTTAEF